MASAAQTIHNAIETVQRARAQCAADAALATAFHAIKSFQSRRFAATYADLLERPDTAPAARFFLVELYGERDFSQRDAQFSRIAAALDRLFPTSVVDTAVELAQLHALTESLDLAMACAWRDQPWAGPEATASRYLRCWRQVGAAAEREQQLEAVLALGRSLARLTRRPGLRTLLRMMRGPAQAAGLSALQAFLEAGFDTFGQLAQQPSAVQDFLETISVREHALLRNWFDTALQATQAAEASLCRLLGPAPAPPGLS